MSASLRVSDAAGSGVVAGSGIGKTGMKSSMGGQGMVLLAALGSSFSCAAGDCWVKFSHPLRPQPGSWNAF